MYIISLFSYCLQTWLLFKAPHFFKTAFKHTLLNKFLLFCSLICHKFTLYAPPLFIIINSPLSSSIPLSHYHFSFIIINSTLSSSIHLKHSLLSSSISLYHHHFLFIVLYSSLSSSISLYYYQFHFVIINFTFSSSIPILSLLIPFIINSPFIVRLITIPNQYPGHVRSVVSAITSPSSSSSLHIPFSSCPDCLCLRFVGIP